MEVTEVRVFLADEDDERLKAYATITFDHCFVVRDLKIINGNTGLFVAMPSKKRKDGTYKDVAHPIHSDFRQALERKILDKYSEEVRDVANGLPRTVESPITGGNIQRVSVGGETSSDRPVFSAQLDFEDGVGPASLRKS